MTMLRLGRKAMLTAVWCGAVLLIALIVFSEGFAGYAEPVSGQEAPGCPGEQMDVQATGVYRGQPVDEVVINGEPWGGAYWEEGMRSYWHCHRGGQVLLMWEGEGRIQNRGERVRILHRGDMSYAPPWVEHWHGASPDSDAQWLQVSVQPTGTYWMEEVGEADYLGNDIGITSREEFLSTGVQEKNPPR